MPNTDLFFAVEHLEQGPFQAMILSLDFRRPEEWLPELPAALRLAGITGRVVLDLLACNGNMWNRYFSAEVDLQTDQVQFLRHESDAWLAEVSASVLVQYLPFLDLSLLSEESQLAVRKGIPLHPSLKPSSRLSANSPSPE